MRRLFNIGIYLYHFGFNHFHSSYWCDDSASWLVHCLSLLTFFWVCCHGWTFIPYSFSVNAYLTFANLPWRPWQSRRSTDMNWTYLDLQVEMFVRFFFFLAHREGNHNNTCHIYIFCYLFFFSWFPVNFSWLWTKARNEKEAEDTFCKHYFRNTLKRFFDICLNVIIGNQLERICTISTIMHLRLSNNRRPGGAKQLTCDKDNNVQETGLEKSKCENNHTFCQKFKHNFLGKKKINYFCSHLSKKWSS